MKIKIIETKYGIESDYVLLELNGQIKGLYLNRTDEEILDWVERNWEDLIDKLEPETYTNRNGDECRSELWENIDKDKINRDVASRYGAITVLSQQYKNMDEKITKIIRETLDDNRILEENEIKEHFKLYLKYIKTRPQYTHLVEPIADGFKHFLAWRKNLIKIRVDLAKSLTKATNKLPRFYKLYASDLLVNELENFKLITKRKKVK